jgi:hypothetical protein
MMRMMLSMIHWSGGKKVGLSILMLQTLLANTLPFLQLQHHQNDFGAFWQKKVYRACTSEWWSGRVHDVHEGELGVPAHTLPWIEEEETVREVHHLVNLKFNYLIAMDEDDEDIDVSENDHLLDFWPGCVGVILLSLSTKKGLLFSCWSARPV